MYICAALVWLVLWTGADREEPRIEDLHVERQGAELRVSFRLVDAFDEGFLARIQSGLTTDLRYRIKLEHPRRLWFDNTLRRGRLDVAVTYNAVTREYQINYKYNDRLIDSRVVQETGELERAMTIFHALPVFAFEDRLPGGQLVVRVRANLGSRNLLLLIPTALHTDWADSARFRMVDEE